MINTREILMAHQKTDGCLMVLETTTKSATKRNYWAHMRVLNDHAYFMLIFGRFEQHLNDQCDRLIAKRKLAPHWKRRRIWDGLDVDRMSFMRKVALLMDKGHTDYATIKDLYENIRCAIAHGDNASVRPIVLPTLASNLRRLSGKLKAQ